MSIVSSKRSQDPTNSSLENAAAARPPRPKRRFAILAAVLLGMTLLVGLLPTIVAHTPLMAYLVRRAAMLEGTITFQQASIGWLSPACVSGIEVRDAQGGTVLVADSLACDRSLLKLLLNPANVGTLRLERPRLDARLNGDGSNVESVLAHWLTGKSTSSGSVNLTLEIVDGEANVVAQHRLLKYVIPILASVAQSQGEFSIHIDGCRIPFGDLDRAEIAGRVVVHSATMSAGPLVQQLALLVGTSPSLVRIQPESVIQFRMTGGRIYHQGLVLEFPDVTVQTYGSVGLDESMKLMIGTSIPLRWLPSNSVTDAIRRQKVQLPVGGTLKSPRLDLAELAQVKNQVLGSLARSVLQSDLGSQLDHLLKPQR